MILICDCDFQIAIEMGRGEEEIECPQCGKVWRIVRLIDLERRPHEVIMVDVQTGQEHST